MVPVLEVENPRVTEIQVRIDCNGCVQKIKKALNGITGIYDVCVDLPQQKLTIIGWADPEKLVKAIKKTRKTATICPETGPSDPASQTSEPPPAGSSTSPPDATKPPGADGGPPAEPSKEPAPPENSNPHQPAQENPSSAPPETKEQSCSSGLRDGEVYVIYDSRNYSHNHGSSGRYYSWYNCPTAQAIRVKLPEQNNVNHIYNTYRPSPYLAEYLEIPTIYAHSNRTDLYGGEYLSSCRGRGNITSIFSDENPNACTIM